MQSLSPNEISLKANLKENSTEFGRHNLSVPKNMRREGRNKNEKTKKTKTYMLNTFLIMIMQYVG